MNAGTVLHLIESTGPGGGETIYIDLAQAAKDEGYRSITVVSGPGWVQSELELRGLEHRVIDCKGTLNFRFLRKVIGLIRSEGVTRIQSHFFGTAVYACMAGLLCRVPVVATIHGHVDIAPKERARLLKLLIIRLGAKKVVAVTDQLKSFLLSQPLLTEKLVATVYNGIDADSFSRIESNHHRMNAGIGDAPLIGSLGNIREPKNYPLAIATIAKLHERGHKVHYAVAGQGSDEKMAELEALATELGIADFVHLLGFKESTQAFLSELDIFLMSSSSEGHPLALTQAMINGVPIVSTPSGVEEIVIDGVEAAISPNHDAEALADSIARLLEDESYANYLTATAKMKALTHFSKESMTRQYMALYRDSEHIDLPIRSAQDIRDRFGGLRGALLYYSHRCLTPWYRWVKRYDRVEVPVKRIVFVCKGNICRSALAHHCFAAQADTETDSFGLDTSNDKPACPDIVAAARELSPALDLSGHRSKNVASFNARDGDLYVCMEPQQARQLLAAIPSASPENILLLGYFSDPETCYIHDPYGHSALFAQRSTRIVRDATLKLATAIHGAKTS